MGREIKRVPLDFDWPLDQIWEGYKNPFHFSVKCHHCDGSGYGPEAKRISDQWYGYAPFDPAETGSIPLATSHPAIVALAQRNGHHELSQVQRLLFYGKAISDEEFFQVECKRLADMFNKQWCHHLEQADVDALWAEGRLSDFNPAWRENRNEGVISPSAETVNFWSIGGMGHDSINHWICVKAKVARLGYTLTCPHCDDGYLWPSKMHKWLEEEGWKRIDPPSGEGWQIWETVSEGSPISPVFKSQEELENYLIEKGYSEGAAEQFAKQGWAPSMTMNPEGTIYNDIESLNMD